MLCSKCGRQLVEGAAFCAYCGEPVKEVADSAVSDSDTEKTEPAEVKEENEPAFDSPEYWAQSGTASVSSAGTQTVERISAGLEGDDYQSRTSAEPPSTWIDNYSDSPEKSPKKGKGGRILAIVAAIILVIAGVIAGGWIFARAQIENFIHVNFDKPRNYFVYVVNKNAQEPIEQWKNYYAMAMDKQKRLFNSAQEENFRMQFGTRGKDFLKLTVGTDVDVSWLDNVGVKYYGNIRDKKGDVRATLTLNNEELLNFIGLFDFKLGDMVFQLPELTEKYLSNRLETPYFDESMDRYVDAYQALFEAYPDAETADRLTRKYLAYVLELLGEDTVEKLTKQKLEAEDVSMDCTLLTVTLREKELRNFVEQVSKEMIGDEDIKQIVKRFANAYLEMGIKNDPEETSEKLVEEFLEALEKLPENFDKQEIDRIKLEIYVDKKSKICGSTFTTYYRTENKKELRYTMLTPNKEDRIGFEYSIKRGESGFVLTGSGKLREDILEGDYRMKVDDKKTVSITIEEWDLAEMKKGRICGRFILKPGSDVDFQEYLKEEFFDDDPDSPAYVLISSLSPSLDIKVDADLRHHDLEMAVLDGGLEIVNFSLSGGEVEGTEITLPTDTIDMNESPELYLKEIKFKTLVEKLKKAGLPEKYIKSVEQLENTLKQYLEYMEYMKKYQDGLY